MLVFGSRYYLMYQSLSISQQKNKPHLVCVTVFGLWRIIPSFVSSYGSPPISYAIKKIRPWMEGVWGLFGSHNPYPILKGNETITMGLTNHWTIHWDDPPSATQEAALSAPKPPSPSHFGFGADTSPKLGGAWGIWSMGFWKHPPLKG